MKRLIQAVLLAGLLLLGLAACGREEPPAPVWPDETAFFELAAQTAADLRAGDFETVTERFHPDAAALGGEALEAQYTRADYEAGPLAGSVSTVGRKGGDYFVCTVTEHRQQGQLVLTLTMTQDLKISSLQLDLTPAAPAPAEGGFTETRVTVAADPSFPLNGLLTLPSGTDRPPVVLLIQGAGPADRDERVGPNAPFRDIAHGLAEQGVASLRFDKRPFAYPDYFLANRYTVTLEDEILDDVYAALDLLKRDPRVNNDQIFLLGHALGGSLTPAIASTRPELRGVISMAGSLRPAYEVAYDRNKALESSTLAASPTQEELDTLTSQMAQVEEDIHTLRGDLRTLPNDLVLLGLPINYQRSLKRWAGQNYINTLDTPILVLQGEADFQVSPAVDFALWREVLGARSSASFRLYPGLNHLMMTSSGAMNATEYQQKGTVSRQVTQDVAAFITQCLR